MPRCASAKSISKVLRGSLRDSTFASQPAASGWLSKGTLSGKNSPERYVSNAFWQKVVFRGYLQKRLTDSYGISKGILISSFLFTIIHGLARDISILEVILGTVLFSLIGVIYYITNSIIFCTTIHATGNFFLRSFDTNHLYLPGQIYRIIIYSAILIIVLIIIKKNKRFIMFM